MQWLFSLQSRRWCESFYSRRLPSSCAMLPVASSTLRAITICSNQSKSSLVDHLIERIRTKNEKRRRKRKRRENKRKEKKNEKTEGYHKRLSFAHCFSHIPTIYPSSLRRGLRLHHPWPPRVQEKPHRRFRCHHQPLPGCLSSSSSFCLPKRLLLLLRLSYGHKRDTGQVLLVRRWSSRTTSNL